MAFKLSLPVVAAGLLVGSALAGGAFYALNGHGISPQTSQSFADIQALTQAVDRDENLTQAQAGAHGDSAPPFSAYPPVHFKADNLSGAFLSSQFAQRHQQWEEAADYLQELRNFHGDNPTLLKKSIVLEMGAGSPKAAVDAAKSFLEQDKDDPNSRALAHLFVIADAFKAHDYDSARAQVKTLPDDGLTLFMKPVIQGWLQALDGKFYQPLLHGHRMHLMSAASIADFLNDKKQLSHILAMLSSYDDLSGLDQERLADMYMASGFSKKAHKIYAALLQASPASHRLTLKAESETFLPSLSVYQRPSDPAQGVAYAIYDMATLLYRDGATDSARIFNNMALYLDPDLSDAYILKAAMALQFDDYQAALQAYDNVPETSAYYYQTQRAKASAYDQAGQPDKAIALLQRFYKTSHDLQSLIEIGDIQRRNGRFADALATYNSAIQTHLGGEIPAHYWNLHYVRGMVEEQLGDWDAARTDLERALELYPNHPFILNYLGYAMADRGVELDKALAMIDQALSMQPNDGSITDSLGWVHYKMGNYAQAATYLERAIELMPADPIVNDHLGDAYWQVGRKLEARYQWKRAKQIGKADAKLLSRIDDKLAHGLHDQTLPIQAAQSHIHDKAVTD